MLGTSPASIDAAEDREQFNALCERLGIPQPEGAMATDADDAVAVANRIGYPVLVRPSYVLGGRAMQIVYDDADLRRAMAELAHTGSLGREGGLVGGTARRSSTGSSRTRSRSTSTRCATAPARASSAA